MSGRFHAVVPLGARNSGAEFRILSCPTQSLSLIIWLICGDRRRIFIIGLTKMRRRIAANIAKLPDCGPPIRATVR